jgi:lysylphosphatidylglycerol synthetase-like protein (DUF2156 family)
VGTEELRREIGIDERARALELAARLGENPFAFCLRYEAPWRFVFGSGVDGAVAYLERDRVALVWSDPIATPENAGALLADATSQLRGRGLRTCLVLVGEETARHARGSGYAVLKIGEQPFFSLADWRQPRGDRGKHLR